MQCDDDLAKAILGVPPAEPLVLESSDLLKRVMARMLDTSSLPPPKVAKEDKGKLTPIDIQTATRTGNKKVHFIPCKILSVFKLETFTSSPNFFFR